MSIFFKSKTERTYAVGRLPIVVLMLVLVAAAAGVLFHYGVFDVTSAPAAELDADCIRMCRIHDPNATCVAECTADVASGLMPRAAVRCIAALPVVDAEHLATCQGFANTLQEN